MAEIFTFDQMLLFGTVGILLILGLILRAKIKFFQRFFVPACITAGIIGLILKELGIIQLAEGDLKYFAYHLFNITFISLGLTARSKVNHDADYKKKEFRGILSMGLLISAVAALQFIIGGVLTFIFNMFGYNLFPTFGFLVPMGFEEGPGQALSIGQTWEGFGFANASTIGLSFAMFGFLVAIFVGVPLVGWAIKKGYTNVKDADVSKDFKTGIIAKDQEKKSASVHTTHSSAIDTLTVHASLIGLVYVLTYFFVVFLESIAPEDIAEMFWGFFFIWGLIIAYIIRIIIQKIGAGHILDYRMQSRITGWGVDFLIVTSITAISLSIVLEYITPIIIMGVCTAIFTLLFVLYLGKRIWDEYNFERLSGIFGMETGTVATGLVLIRLSDPSFKTPAATDLAVSSIIALPFLFAMLNVMNGPILFGWSLGFTILIFVIFEVVILVLFKLFKLWMSPKL